METLVKTIAHLCFCLSISACGISAVARAQDTPWKRYTIDDTLRGADGVRLADINGDQLLDVVTGWEESGLIRIYIHPGTGSVKEAWPACTLGASPAVEDAVWVDLNGDQQLDVLSSCEGQEQCLWVFFAPTDRSRLLQPDAWTSQRVPASQGLTRWMFAQPLQGISGTAEPPTNDGVVVGSKSPGGRVALLHCASANVEQWHLEDLVDADWIMSIFCLDLDGDGDSDIVYDDRKGASSGVYWLENIKTSAPRADSARAAPPAQWRQHLIGGLGREVMFMSFPTANPGELHRRHQSRSLYAATKPYEILRFLASPADNGPLDWSRQAINFESYRSRIGRAKAVAVGDLDQDGVDELVVSCEGAEQPKSGVFLLKQSGDQWTFHDVSGPEGIKFDLLELIDLDNDGDLDILTCEERHQGKGLGVIWYANPLRSKSQT